MENTRGWSFGMNFDISCQWPVSISVFYRSESISVLAWQVLGKDDVICFCCKGCFLEVSLNLMLLENHNSFKAVLQ